MQIRGPVFYTQNLPACANHEMSAAADQHRAAANLSSDNAQIIRQTSG